VKLKKNTPLLCILCLFGFFACKSAPKQEAAPLAAPEETTVKEVPPAAPVPETPPAPVAVDYSAANSNLLAAAAAARDAAIAAGAPDLYAELYSSAETMYETVQKQCASESVADCSVQIKDVTARYQALEKAALAQKMKERIDSLQFSSYDAASYASGDTALNSFKTATADADQLSFASTAYNSYQLVLTKAFKFLAAKERSAALDAKKDADSVKAAVSQKDAYIQAADAFKKADSAYVMQNIEGAYAGYLEAHNSFSALFETVSKNRAAAQEAIDRAKKRSEETKLYAGQADTVAPLGDGEVKGIESEDKTLLDADSLANPDDAVIDVTSGDTAQSVQSDATVQEAQ
jgi:hypothetical protein